MNSTKQGKTISAQRRDIPVPASIEREQAGSQASLSSDGNGTKVGHLASSALNDTGENQTRRDARTFALHLKPVRSFVVTTTGGEKKRNDKEPKA